MSCADSLVGRVSQLSLQDPRSAIQSLVDVHEDLITALQQANAIANQSSSTTSVLSEFQRITGCRRTEAMFYLKQSNNDIRWVPRDCSARCRSALSSTAAASAWHPDPTSTAAQIVCMLPLGSYC
jgi:hypothetical protein